MLYLIASLIALLAGPISYRLLASGSAFQKGLDGFIFVSLSGLVLIHILPELLEHGGWLALLFVAIGIWGPTMSERLFHRHSELTHNLTLILGIGGLLLHTLTDGGALVLAQQPDSSLLLALGIILHRLPVGITIWWLMKPQVGSRWATFVLFLMMLLTTIGYLLGEQFLTELSLQNTVYLQAFVTGSILHVVLHQPHVDQPHDPQGKFEYHAGIGSLLGIGVLLVLMFIEAEDTHQHFDEQHLSAFGYWVFDLLPLLTLTLLLGLLRQNIWHRLPLPNYLKTKLPLLVTPETLLLTLLILGLPYAIFQLMVGGLLTMFLNNKVTSKTEGSLALIDNNAALVTFSLLLVNILGQPTGLLSSAITQLLLLLPVFILCRFTPLSATVLAASLAFQQWHSFVVLFTLLLPPLLSAMQIKHHIKPLLLGIMASIVVFRLFPDISELLTGHLPYPTYLLLTSGAVLGVLFSVSLLRLGPRAFLKKLWSLPAKDHHHH